MLLLQGLSHTQGLRYSGFLNSMLASLNFSMSELCVSLMPGKELETGLEAVVDQQLLLHFRLYRVVG